MSRSKTSASCLYLFITYFTCSQQITFTKSISLNYYGHKFNPTTPSYTYARILIGCTSIQLTTYYMQYPFLFLKKKNFI